MQSRLPDINSAFIKRRNNVEDAIASKDWDKAYGNLNAWNACLPDHVDEDGIMKYRVRISDIDYDQKVEIRSVATCTNPSCRESIDYKKITQFELITPLVESVLTGCLVDKVWICAKCDANCKIKDTMISDTIIKEPSYLGVVPNIPSRKDGLQDRTRFDRKMVQWCYNFVAEIEQGTTKFREDYKSNKDDFEDWESQIDGGEEE